MRTDSTRLSNDFYFSHAKPFILEKFGPDYLGSIKVGKKSDLVQDAHEAIRPTGTHRTPDLVARYVEPDEAKLYRLIYDRALASLMTMKKLLEAGVHFGHQTRRWNPKMGRFIYGARNGIYLIDLTKTCTSVNDAYKRLKSIVDEEGKVLFVGTKPAAQQIVIDEATRSGSFYISHRWLGGTLTNFRTILGRIKYLKDLEAMDGNGRWAKARGLPRYLGHKEACNRIIELFEVCREFKIKYMGGYLSLNLAIFNLLPFPGLDGWQLLVTILESGFKKKVSEKVKNTISIIGLGLLFAFAIAITIKDIVALVINDA